MLAKLLLCVGLLSVNQDIHWREGTTLVMCGQNCFSGYAYSLWIKIYVWRDGTTLVMLVKLLLCVCLLSLNQDRHWRRRYNIGNVGKTTSMCMLNLLWISIYIDVHIHNTPMRVKHTNACDSFSQKKDIQIFQSANTDREFLIILIECFRLSSLRKYWEFI